VREEGEGIRGDPRRRRNQGGSRRRRNQGGSRRRRDMWRSKEERRKVSHISQYKEVL